MITKDNGKYNAIFLEFYDSTMKIIGRRVKNYHLAQDICQETFMRLYANIDKIDEESVKGWLIVTARNIATDLARESKHVEYMNAFDEKGDEVFERMTAPKYSIELEYNEKLRREFRLRVLNHIKTINEDWHKIIAYSVIMDISQDEIADYLGISKEALRGKLCRARKWLKEEYDVEYQDLKETNET